MPFPRIGISGWTYAPWRGTFYPKGLVRKKELEYATRHLGTLEINGTFHSLQRPTSFGQWHDTAPADFVFAVKGPQYITHVRRLKDVEEPLANFLASGLLKLGRKLGPILWQFPPNVMLKDDRFDRFLELLPRTSREAARLAKRHGPRMEGRAWTKAEGDFFLRHAFEFRHKSFQSPDFLARLRAFGAALVLAHGHSRWPYLEEHTADFVYARLHGEGLKKGYSPRQLDEWAEKVTEWSRRRDVFLYFSNDAKITSPKNALALMDRLGLVRQAA